MFLWGNSLTVVQATIHEMIGLNFNIDLYRDIKKHWKHSFDLENWSTLAWMVSWVYIWAHIKI